MSIAYKNIPTREADGTWTYTQFESKQEFRDFLKQLFKEPGKYNLLPPGYTVPASVAGIVHRCNNARYTIYGNNVQLFDASLNTFLFLCAIVLSESYK